MLEKEKSPREMLADMKDTLKSEVRREIMEFIKDNADIDCYEGECESHLKWDTVQDRMIDAIHELIDGSVPIYNSELMELASLQEVYTHENELPPAFNGENTPLNNIATSIYEILQEAGYDEIREIEDDFDDILEELAEEEEKRRYKKIK